MNTQPLNIESAIRELLARQQIHDALMRICRGVDRLDRDLILSGYHPGARDNHGSFDGPVEKFVDWVFELHVGTVLSCVHHIGNVLIAFEGKTAHCESYGIVFQRRMIEGTCYDMTAHGRYIDRFEERNGQWKIAERLLLLDWDRLDPVGRQLDAPLTMKVEKSKRSREDASYRALKPGLFEFI